MTLASLVHAPIVPWSALAFALFAFAPPPPDEFDDSEEPTAVDRPVHK